MAKGYWIARVDVHNEEGYKAYARSQPRDLQEIRRPLPGARRQVRGHRRHSRSRNVVIEFNDYETALACYIRRNTRPTSSVRQPHSKADLVIIEGYDGPQP